MTQDKTSFESLFSLIVGGAIGSWLATAVSMLIGLNPVPSALVAILCTLAAAYGIILTRRERNNA